MSSKKHPKSTETPEVRELFTTIASLQTRAIGFSDVIVRSVGAKHATQASFFSGKGAAKTGGRWNRIGIEAVYASLDVLTATKRPTKILSLQFASFEHSTASDGRCRSGLE